MTKEVLQWCPAHGYPLPCYKCGLMPVQLKQEEIQLVIHWLKRIHEFPIEYVAQKIVEELNND